METKRADYPLARSRVNPATLPMEIRLRQRGVVIAWKNNYFSQARYGARSRASCARRALVIIVIVVRHKCVFYRRLTPTRTRRSMIYRLIQLRLVNLGSLFQTAHRSLPRR